MITIQKGQSAKEDKNLIVISESGVYSDYDLVTCEDATDPLRQPVSFQAQYIVYGPMIYQFGDKLEELGAEILKLDPTSNHDAVAYHKDEEARRIRREGGLVRPENATTPEQAMEQVSVASTESSTQPVAEPVVEQPTVQQNNPSSSPEPVTESTPTTEQPASSTPPTTGEPVATEPVITEIVPDPVVTPEEIPVVTEPQVIEPVTPPVLVTEPVVEPVIPVVVPETTIEY